MHALPDVYYTASAEERTVDESSAYGLNLFGLAQDWERFAMYRIGWDGMGWHGTSPVAVRWPIAF